MIIGYARVSTTEQKLDLQISALKEAGCEKIFEDKVSGVRSDRPGFSSLKAHLRSGDKLIVWRLDRLGRSLNELITLVQELNSMGVAVQSLKDSTTFDTSSATGKLVLGIIALLAEFEGNLVRERTCAGLAAARARGRNGGRKVQHSDAKISAVHRLVQTTDRNIGDICKEFGISRDTYYTRLRQLK